MPSFADSTPAAPPESWEDHPVFRETFLAYFTPPEVNAALRVLGRAAYDLILEHYHRWPAWPESATATEMRAAAADLRHLCGFLAAVGREHEEAALSTADTKLSLLGREQAAEVMRIAEAIERALAQEA
jgi:hypothetical protein